MIEVNGKILEQLALFESVQTLDLCGYRIYVSSHEFFLTSLFDSSRL